jgi:hypothetical protein
MRLLTLFFLPLCLWSQQIDVQWNWQGVEQLHVGDQLKRVPKAIGQTVFYDEEHKRFAISISKQFANDSGGQTSPFTTSTGKKYGSKIKHCTLAQTQTVRLCGMVSRMTAH